jgi:tetratricopeptide (TPR) repeat protein
MTRPLLKAFLLLVVAFVAVGCKSEPHERANCAELDAGAPIDPVLLAFLSNARSGHHLADGKERDGDLAGAAAALEGLLKAPAPTGEPRPEVREVLADTQARLADLYSRQGDQARASAAIERGLELATDPNYFRGHLVEVRGTVEERRADALNKSGDAAGAKAAREAALRAFEEAMRIQSSVIQKAAPR